MSSMSTDRAPAAAQASGAAATTAQIFANLQNTAIPALLPIKGSGANEQKKLVIRASGYIKSGTTANVQVTLYSGSSLTPGSNTVIAQSTARAQNSANAPFMIEASVLFDLVSGKLHGHFLAVVNNLLDAPAAITALTGLVAAEPIINLCVGISWSATNAGNVANLQELVLDA